MSDIPFIDDGTQPELMRSERREKSMEIYQIWLHYCLQCPSTGNRVVNHKNKAQLKIRQETRYENWNSKDKSEDETFLMCKNNHIEITREERDLEKCVNLLYRRSHIVLSTLHVDLEYISSVCLEYPASRRYLHVFAPLISCLTVPFNCLITIIINNTIVTIRTYVRPFNNVANLTHLSRIEITLRIFENVFVVVKNEILKSV